MICYGAIQMASTYLLQLCQLDTKYDHQTSSCTLEIESFRVVSMCTVRVKQA